MTDQSKILRDALERIRNHDSMDHSPSKIAKMALDAVDDQENLSISSPKIDTSGEHVDEPNTWLLPCDIKVGPGTHGKGTKLRTFVARMERLHKEYVKLVEAENDMKACFAIEVEKLLCAKLGRQWAATGISIDTLIEDLADQRAQQKLDAAMANIRGSI